MRGLRFLTMVLAPGVLLPAARANAQVELNVHAGAMLAQDPDEPVLAAFDGGVEFLVGARVVLNPDGGPGLSLSGDRLSLDAGTVWLYSAALEYTLPSTRAAHLFVGIGLGGATTDFDDDFSLAGAGGLDVDLDTETDLLVPIYFGFKGFNRQTDPDWALRVEIRDNVIFSEDVSGSTETFNNWEISAGLSWILGT